MCDLCQTYQGNILHEQSCECRYCSSIKNDDNLLPYFTILNAAYYGHISCIDKIVNNNQCFDNFRDGIGQTPLMIACDKKNNIECVKKLLAYKSDPYIKNMHGQNSFYFASRNNNLDYIKCLLNVGL